MPDYLFYWKPETVNATPEHGPLLYSASDQFDRLASGDVLWIVTSQGRNDLRLVGRIAVMQVTSSQAEARAHVGRQDLWEAGWYALADPEQAQPKQDLSIGHIAAELRFEGTPDHLPADFSGQNLQSMRRLTTESADLLEQQWTSNAGRLRRNPPWQRDELILALDLYMRVGRRVADDTDAEVIALSGII